VSFWTQQDLDALKAAVASGVLRVRYKGPPEREVEYQSLAEMRSLLAEMRGQLEPAARRFRRAVVSKGM
jgi:hypothetical protein